MSPRSRELSSLCDNSAVTETSIRKELKPLTWKRIASEILLSTVLGGHLFAESSSTAFCRHMQGKKASCATNAGFDSRQFLSEQVLDVRDNN